VAETGSTNTDLLDAATAGAPDRSVLVTDHQTAGRGRLDRRWDAPPGDNLLVSFLFRLVPERPTDLTRAVGVAAVEAIAARTPLRPVLKWPNDVLLDDRKLAGILAHLAPDGSVVVGLGVNVGWAPEGAASLGAATDPATLLDDVLGRLDVALAMSHDELDERYRSMLATLGRSVRVELTSGELIGRAIGVDPDGRLVVLDDCSVSHRIDVGDVVHLRPGE
jgi:BirA family biotin operon repressor/biotin-[acetyl-CoA-carboxylase] ligase